MDQADIDRIAERVVELLRDVGHHGTPRDLVDVPEIANRFSVSRDFIYEHSTELGAVRLGDGPRARLRFDPKIVAERLAPRPDPRTKPDPSPVGRRRPRSAAAPLLPIRGKEKPRG